MARKATVKRFAERRETLITKDMVKSMSASELKTNIRIYGKRAQSRLSALKKSLPKLADEGQEGMAEMILDRFAGYNTKIKGLSANALRAKLFKAIDVLNMETSTAAGIRNLEKKRYETFKKKYPGMSDISIDKYRQYVKVMGKVQAAHAGLEYDSELDIYAAVKSVELEIPVDFFTKIKNPQSWYAEDDYITMMESLYGFN